MSTSPPLLRTSERKDWRRCPWLWSQTWLNSMRPIRPPTWSWFGTAWHLAMEARYPVGRKRGSVADVVDAFEAACKDHRGRIYVELDEATEEEWEDAVELGKVMAAEYCRFYGSESEWEVIHTEQPFQIDVPHPTKPGKNIVIYAGTWDLLAWNVRLKQFWLWDHKSAKTIPSAKFLDLDDQAGSYLWVAKEVLLHKGLMKKKDQIEGIIFNYAKKAMPDPRPTDDQGRALNKDGTVSKLQPAPRFLRHETFRTPAQSIAQARRVQQEAQVMDLMRRGKLPIWKNPAKECDRCPLYDPCESHERGDDDWREVLATIYHSDDVYADHRADMERGGIELPAKLL